MIKRLAMWLLLFFLASVSALAQGLKTRGLTWTGEFEFNQTQKAGQAYDNYWFGHNPKLEILGRVFFAKNSLKRGEFAGGRAFSLLKGKDSKPRLILIPYVGLTTDGAMFTPVVAVVNLWGRDGQCLADPKFYFNANKLNTLYQEASVPLTKTGGWQFRWERLKVFGVLTVFNRFGMERRIWLPKKVTGNSSYFHVSPFIDSTKNQIGFYSGFRWQ